MSVEFGIVLWRHRSATIVSFKKLSKSGLFFHYPTRTKMRCKASRIESLNCLKCFNRGLILMFQSITLFLLAPCSWSSADTSCMLLMRVDAAAFFEQRGCLRVIKSSFLLGRFSNSDLSRANNLKIETCPSWLSIPLMEKLASCESLRRNAISNRGSSFCNRSCQGGKALSMDTFPHVLASFWLALIDAAFWHKAANKCDLITKVESWKNVQIVDRSMWVSSSGFSNEASSMFCNQIRIRRHVPHDAAFVAVWSGSSMSHSAKHSCKGWESTRRVISFVSNIEFAALCWAFSLLPICFFAAALGKWLSIKRHLEIASSLLKLWAIAFVPFSLPLCAF